MSSFGETIAKEDMGYKKKKELKKEMPKILSSQRKRLEKALEKNNYLTDTVKKCKTKIKKLTDKNKKQYDMLENIVFYLEELEKDKKSNNKRLEDIKKDKEKLLKKLKAIEIDLDILSG